MVIQKYPCGTNHHRPCVCTPGQRAVTVTHTQCTWPLWLVEATCCRTHGTLTPSGSASKALCTREMTQRLEMLRCSPQRRGRCSLKRSSSRVQFQHRAVLWYYLQAMHTQNYNRESFFCLLVVTRPTCLYTAAVENRTFCEEFKFDGWNSTMAFQSDLFHLACLKHAVNYSAWDWLTLALTWTNLSPRDILTNQRKGGWAFSWV